MKYFRGAQGVCRNGTYFMLNFVGLSPWCTRVRTVTKYSQRISVLDHAILFYVLHTEKHFPSSVKREVAKRDSDSLLIFLLARQL